MGLEKSIADVSLLLWYSLFLPFPRHPPKSIFLKRKVLGLYLSAGLIPEGIFRD